MELFDDLPNRSGVDGRGEYDPARCERPEQRCDHFLPERPVLGIVGVFWTGEIDHDIGIVFFRLTWPWLRNFLPCLSVFCIHCYIGTSSCGFALATKGDQIRQKVGETFNTPAVLYGPTKETILY